jgi:hypothetical protein
MLDQTYVFDGQPTTITAPTTCLVRKDNGAMKVILVHTIPFACCRRRQIDHTYRFRLTSSSVPKLAKRLGFSASRMVIDFRHTWSNLRRRQHAGALAHLAADSSFNTTNINLVGLAQTGIEYIPVG